MSKLYPSDWFTNWWSLESKHIPELGEHLCIVFEETFDFREMYFPHLLGLFHGKLYLFHTGWLPVRVSFFQNYPDLKFQTCALPDDKLQTATCRICSWISSVHTRVSPFVYTNQNKSISVYTSMIHAPQWSKEYNVWNNYSKQQHNFARETSAREKLVYSRWFLLHQNPQIRSPRKKLACRLNPSAVLG